MRVLFHSATDVIYILSRINETHFEECDQLGQCLLRVGREFILHLGRSVEHCTIFTLKWRTIAHDASEVSSTTGWYTIASEGKNRQGTDVGNQVDRRPNVTGPRFTLTRDFAIFVSGKR